MIGGGIDEMNLVFELCKCESLFLIDDVIEKFFVGDILVFEVFFVIMVW